MFNSRALVAGILFSTGGLMMVAAFAAAPSAIAKNSAAKPGDSMTVRKHAGRIAAGVVAQSTPLGASSGPGWSIVTSPNEATTGTGFLQSVVCSNASDCWAVGDFHSGSKTLIEHWDGAAWTIIDSPNNPGYNRLNAVTCPSASDCWAVGNFLSPDNNGFWTEYTLVEHWNGLSWSIVDSANVENAGQNLLYAVSCPSSNECWAVGYYSCGAGSCGGGLIEHWNGTDWTVVAPASGVYELYGLTCVSTSQCWAVGNGSSGSVIEEWNGVSWSIAPSPSVGGYLFAVSCSSAVQCFALGNGLIEQWNGATWSVMSNPGLLGITCSSEGCWAVGDYLNNGVRKTLIELWNGSSWAVVASPTTSTPPNDGLMSVACASPVQCWAVGASANDAFNFTYSKTLVLEYAPTVPPLINVASRMTHGSAGPFDIDLSLIGPRGVECRSGGANGNYSVVFSFVNDVTSCGSVGTVGGVVVAGPKPNQCTENLTDVANAQYITVELDNVLDSQNNTGNVAVSMGVLLGDVNATGLVDSGDVFLVRQQTGQNANSSNFREDVNASGLIDSGGVFLTRQQTGTSLP
jgi:hypothetical protein